MIIFIERLNTLQGEIVREMKRVTYCQAIPTLQKLSRVLIVITLVFYLPNLYFLNNHGIAGLLITVLGLYAIFKVSFYFISRETLSNTFPRF